MQEAPTGLVQPSDSFQVTLSLRGVPGNHLSGLQSLSATSWQEPLRTNLLKSIPPMFPEASPYIIISSVMGE